MSQQVATETVLACANCGRAFPPSDVVQIAGNWVCASCKPAFLSRLVASGAAPSFGGWHYGGLWIRFGARMVDGLIMGVPLLILFAFFMPNFMRLAQSGTPPAPGAMAGFTVSMIALFWGAGMAYEVVMLKQYGATVGKIACGLKVVRPDGSNLDWGVCFGRFFMWNVVTGGIPYLNFILMLVSGIMAGTDAEKRAIHDRVCNTRVIFKRGTA